MSGRRLFSLRQTTPKTITSEQVPEPVVSVPAPRARGRDIPLHDILVSFLPGYSEEQIRDLESLPYIKSGDNIAIKEIIGQLQRAKDPNQALEDILKMKEFNVWELPVMDRFEKQYELNIKMEFAKRQGTILRDQICPRCKGNVYLVNEAQLASADESTTEFRRCVNCGI